MPSEPVLASGYVNDRLIRDLLASIQSGKLAPGSRILSEIDLAERYDISVISVRRALKQLTESGWLQRIQGKGTFVKSGGEPLRGPGRAKSISVVLYSPLLIDKSTAPYMWFLTQRTVQGIVQRAEELQLDVSVKYLTASVEPSIYDRYAFETIPGDALIFLSFDVTPLSVQRLAALRRPAILVDPTEIDPNFTSILSDVTAGICEAVRHLVSLGHREIAWLGGDPASEWKPHSTRRQACFVEALAKMGMEAKPEFLINGGGNETSACEAMRKLLASGRRPSAVLAMNDDRASGVAKAIREAGLRIPDDIALIGCDDAPFAESFDPPLTTIRSSRFESGVEAVNLTVQALSGSGPGPLVKRLPPELIVRASCGWKSKASLVTTSIQKKEN